MNPLQKRKQLSLWQPTPTTDKPWSPQQLDVFDWFSDGEGNLTVRARAGSGKTTAIIEGIARAKEPSILLAAFGTKIAEELKTRITNPRARASTLHSLGSSICREKWVIKDVDRDRGKRLAEKAIEKAGFVPVRDSTMAVHKLVERAKQTLVTETQALIDTAVHLDLRPGKNWGFGLPDLAKLATDAMKLAQEYDGTIDFNDQVYLPVVMGWARPRFDLVVIDEAQDMNAAQLRLAQGVAKGRICVVGDDRQCHPPGTLVELTGGRRVPIENVQIGDQVVTYHECFRGLGSQGRQVLNVGVRQFDGTMLTLSAGGEQVRVTPNHRIPTRLREEATRRWCVYLMERGATSRIGSCQLLYQTGFGPSTRCRHEDADRVWVLGVYDSPDDAAVVETLTALNHGLPENIFMEKGHIRERVMAVIGDNRNRTKACLSAHGLEYEHPIYSRDSNIHIGRYIYLTAACNLLNGVNEVRTFDGTRDGGYWAPVQVSSTPASTKVYSLSVEPTEGGLKLYVADRVLVHNSIYAFRGADSESIDRLKAELKAKELGLTITYRCPVSVCQLAIELVPDLRPAPNARFGTIQGTIDLPAIDTHEIKQYAVEGDFVLSRTNAPLARVCMGLLRKGKRAKIEGRNVGEQIIDTVDRMRAYSIKNLLEHLDVWEKEQVEYLRSAISDPEKQAQKIFDLRDYLETLRVIAMGCQSMEELVDLVGRLFKDDVGNDYIVCSTVHRVKGREASHVFLLANTFYPGGRTSTEEENIHYVAITRAKERLTWCGEPKQARVYEKRPR